MQTYQYKGFSIVVGYNGVTVYKRNTVMFDASSLDAAMRWVNAQMQNPMEA